MPTIFAVLPVLVVGVTALATALALPTGAAHASTGTAARAEQIPAVTPTATPTSSPPPSQTDPPEAATSGPGVPSIDPDPTTPAPAVTASAPAPATTSHAGAPAPVLPRLRFDRASPRPSLTAAPKAVPASASPVPTAADRDQRGGPVGAAASERIDAVPSGGQRLVADNRTDRRDHYLLAIIGAICACGVTIGIIRAIVAERSKRPIRV